jgi:hypothetical protein
MLLPFEISPTSRIPTLYTPRNTIVLSYTSSCVLYRILLFDRGDKTDLCVDAKSLLLPLSFSHTTDELVKGVLRN